MLGTLGGVVVAAAAGLLTAILTGRHQRATLDRQFQQESDNQNPRRTAVSIRGLFEGL